MKYLIKCIALALVALFFTFSQALAADYEIDHAHSSIRFGVQHIYSTVYGHFEDYSGVIRFDPSQPGDSSFHFTVKVNSIQTGIGKRDKHLRSADFFDAGKYPAMTFASTGVRHLEGDLYEVHGVLQVKDVSKEITLAVTYLGSMDHPMEKSKKVAGFDFSLTIDRLAYHVGDGKFHQKGLVGKDVKVFVTLEALTDK